MFNFAGGNRLTALQVVRHILDLMESPLEPKILGTARFEIAQQRVSSARARRELHWGPTVKLADGLRETIAWYRAHLSVSG